jgi:DNA-binding transcriptional ArsR family regulator
VQKHVAVLERAGLVTRERRGREQLVQSRSNAIAAAQRLLDEFEALWRDRIDRIGELVATSETGDKT